MRYQHFLCTLISSSYITFVRKIFTHWTASTYCRKSINHVNVLYMDSLYGFIKGYSYALANTILSYYNFINNFEIFIKYAPSLFFCFDCFSICISRYIVVLACKFPQKDGGVWIGIMIQSWHFNKTVSLTPWKWDTSPFQSFIYLSNERFYCTALACILLNLSLFNVFKTMYMELHVLVHFPFVYCFYIEIYGIWVHLHSLISFRSFWE